jgi:hypothetical protein
MTPMDVFTAPRFNWRAHLQGHLVWSGVNVSDLAPIMGLRLSALMIDLTAAGLADERPGYGLFQITSGVRSFAQQVALYNDICLRQGRCDFVANPYAARSSGPDAEGVLRRGSNHMAQLQSALYGRALGHGQAVSIGHAVDFTNRGAPWSELHRRLPQYGLDWPLKYGAVEPWHVEAFPDRSPSPLGWLPGPWPARPGIHRPLYLGCRGGDVARLQRRLGATNPDGIFGDDTVALVRHANRVLKVGKPGRRPQWWNIASQIAWERATPATRRALRQP